MALDSPAHWLWCLGFRLSERVAFWFRVNWTLEPRFQRVLFIIEMCMDKKIELATLSMGINSIRWNVLSWNVAYRESVCNLQNWCDNRLWTEQDTNNFIRRFIITKPPYPRPFQNNFRHKSYRNDPFGYDCAMHSNDIVSPCPIFISSNFEYEATFGATLPIGSENNNNKAESYNIQIGRNVRKIVRSCVHEMHIECWDKYCNECEIELFLSSSNSK